MNSIQCGKVDSESYHNKTKNPFQNEWIGDISYTNINIGLLFLCMHQKHYTDIHIDK